MTYHTLKCTLPEKCISYPTFQPADLVHINAKIMLRIYKHMRMPYKIPSSAFSQRSTQKQTDNCHHKHLNYRIAIDPLISIPQNTFIFLAYASFCETFAHACTCKKVTHYSKYHILYQKFCINPLPMTLLRYRQTQQSFQCNSESNSEDNIRQFFPSSCSS